jgi:hypothetical protein
VANRSLLVGGRCLAVPRCSLNAHDTSLPPQGANDLRARLPSPRLQAWHLRVFSVGRKRRGITRHPVESDVDGERRRPDQTGPSDDEGRSRPNRADQWPGGYRGLTGRSETSA